MNARGARIARPAVGLGGSTGGEMGSQEGMQAGSRVIGHLLKVDTAGTGPAVLHFDRTDDEDVALMTAPPPPAVGSFLLRQAISVSSTSTRPYSGLRSGATMLARSLAQSSQAVL
ncbi:MAG: hypothetical protein JO007_07525 [Alphaproteobacteria bacterium]|nr:hypothetical protein [Alphaproteobacteria bacterium]